MHIWQQEFGGIRNWWVALDGEPARCCGHVDSTTQEEAIALARSGAALATKKREIMDIIRSEYPESQIYSGFLPSYDTTWEGEEGWYLYVLCPRRKGGKYRIAKAVKY